jgi:ACT domain-containing protein
MKRNDFFMRAVIAVIGKDMVGIIARTSKICWENNINICDISQSVLQDFFAMIMLVDISESKVPFAELSSTLKALGNEMGLSIHIMHEDIFNSMHRI